MEETKNKRLIVNQIIERKRKQESNFFSGKKEFYPHIKNPNNAFRKEQQEEKLCYLIFKLN